MLVTLGLSALLVASGATSSGAEVIGRSAPAVKKLSAAQRQFVDDQVAQLMVGARLPGVSVSITGPKGRYVKTYGVADRATGRRLRTSDHVRIASITKTFTATAVLRLVDRGAIRLGDRLSRWVKGIPHGRQITIRQLLAMRSGIYDFTSNERFLRRFNAHPTMRFKPKDIIPIIKRNEPQFRPGARMVYTDSNYVLLGIIMRKVTGVPVADWLTADVIRPAGLRHTVVPRTNALPSPHAKGYYTGDDGTGPFRNVTRLNPLVPFTAGHMISTLGDLRRWGRVLAEGTLLSKRMRAKQLRFSDFPNAGGMFFGYGLGIMRLGDWLGHDGAILGFSTITMYNPKTGARFVAIGNQSSNFSTPTLELFVNVTRQLYPESL